MANDRAYYWSCSLVVNFCERVSVYMIVQMYCKLKLFLYVVFVQGECFSNSVEYLDTQTLTWHKPRVTVSIFKIHSVHVHNIIFT